MISLNSVFSRPRTPKKETAGDGYQPPYDPGTYEFVPFNETPFPSAVNGVSVPWTSVPSYPIGKGTTPGLQRVFAFAAAEAVRHPGIVGTDAGLGTDPRTTYAPYVTIQQTAIQKALAQRYN